MTITSNKDKIILHGNRGYPYIIFRNRFSFIQKFIFHNSILICSVLSHIRMEILSAKSDIRLRLVLERFDLNTPKNNSPRTVLVITCLRQYINKLYRRICLSMKCKNHNSSVLMPIFFIDTIIYGRLLCLNYLTVINGTKTQDLDIINRFL